ncbi:MAG: hypothetical protein NTZ34_08585 [Chloroflexi bacterium]|nr:hypothetical protein [Chloroflexota bacterium]
MAEEFTLLELPGKWEIKHIKVGMRVKAVFKEKNQCIGQIRDFAIVPDDAVNPD